MRTAPVVMQFAASPLAGLVHPSLELDDHSVVGIHIGRRILCPGVGEEASPARHATEEALLVAPCHGHLWPLD